jgi:hypothetical protein
MIREDLSKMDGCPECGVTVTVYGIPWKAAFATHQNWQTFLVGLAASIGAGINIFASE